MNEYAKVLMLRKEFPQIGIGKVKTALTEAGGDMEVARFYLTSHSEGLTFKLLAILSTPDQEGRKLENLRKTIARDMALFIKDVDTHAEQQISLPDVEATVYKSKEERNLALMKILHTYAKNLASTVRYEMTKPRTIASYLLANPYRYTVCAENETELNTLLTEAVQVYQYENREVKSKSDDWATYSANRYFSEVIGSLASLGITCKICANKEGNEFSVYLYVEEEDVERFKYLVLQGAKSNE